MFSLNDLDAKAKGEAALEVDYVTKEGVETGIKFQILGSESETVQAAINAAVNKRNKQQATMAAVADGLRGSVQVTPIEDDIAFGKRLTAARLAGWSGIKEEFSPENALKLVSSNADVAAFILEVANQSARFLQLKPKA